MIKALKKTAPQAENPKLNSMLEEAAPGIEKHTELLKSLIEDQDDEVKKRALQGNGRSGQ